MKRLFKLVLLLLIQLIPLLLLAQVNEHAPEPDEAMDLFLLVTGSLFVATMFGAAIIGAFLVALVVLLFAGLFIFGIVSTSIIVGLYKRSAFAGIKSFLLLLFGLTCPFAGWILFSFFNKLLPLNFSSQQASFIGLASGLVGGLLLALITGRLLENLLRFVSKRLPAK